MKHNPKAGEKEEQRPAARGSGQVTGTGSFNPGQGRLPNMAATVQRWHSTYGNRAVAQLFKSFSAPQRANDARSDGVESSSGGDSSEVASLAQSPSVVQRKLIYYKPENRSQPISDDEKDLMPKLDTIDKAVNSAYEQFMSGDYSGASAAKVDLYKLRKHQYDTASVAMHPSTAAGYIIEDKVNKLLASESGVQLQAHDILPGTIPDIAVDAKSGNKALLDITASNSAGHILAKKGNWTTHKHIPVVAESLYPSIDFKTMKKQVLSDQDLEKINKKVAMDKEMHALMEAQKQEALKEQFLNRQNNVLYLLSELSSQKKSDFIQLLQQSQMGRGSRKLSQILKCGVDIASGEFVRIDYADWQQEAFSLFDAHQAEQALKHDIPRL